MSVGFPEASGPSADVVEAQEMSISYELVLAAESANRGQSGTRRVTEPMAREVAARSLTASAGEPFSARRHRALSDLSRFVELVQRGKVVGRSPEHTDLLPIAHPLCSREHALTADALALYRSRWYLDDPILASATPVVRGLVASLVASREGTPEHLYAATRLSALPPGSIPHGVLVAGLGDGNSPAARRARAALQRRDRKGRFAYMGGGLDFLFRALGRVFRIKGRIAAYSEDGGYDVELDNGALVRVPFQAGDAQGARAYIPQPGGRGRGGLDLGRASEVRPSKITSADVVLDELEYIDAPTGFRVDEDLDAVERRIRYTDDAYDVTRYGPGADIPAYVRPKDFDPERPLYVVNRRDGDYTRPFAASQSWAEIQDQIQKDEGRQERGLPPNIRLAGRPTEEGRPDDDFAPPAPEDAGVELDLSGDVQAQVEEAIEAGRKIAFMYKGRRRDVTPESIRTAKNGNVNVYAREDGGDIKAYTVSQMEQVSPSQRPVARLPEAPEPAASPGVEIDDPVEILQRFDRDRLVSALRGWDRLDRVKKLAAGGTPERDEQRQRLLFDGEYDPANLKNYYEALADRLYETDEEFKRLVDERGLSDPDVARMFAERTRSGDAYVQVLGPDGAVANLRPETVRRALSGEGVIDFGIEGLPQEGTDPTGIDQRVVEWLDQNYDREEIGLWDAREGDLIYVPGYDELGRVVSVSEREEFDVVGADGEYSGSTEQRVVEVQLRDGARAFIGADPGQPVVVDADGDPVENTEADRGERAVRYTPRDEGGPVARLDEPAAPDEEGLEGPDAPEGGVPPAVVEQPVVVPEGGTPAERRLSYLRQYLEFLEASERGRVEIQERNRDRIDGRGSGLFGDRAERERAEREAYERSVREITAEIEAIENGEPIPVVTLDTSLSPEEQFAAIQEHIRKGEKIRFNYNGTLREVHPRELRTGRDGNINVVTVDDDGNVKTFTIQRMEQAEDASAPGTDYLPPALRGLTPEELERYRREGDYRPYIGPNEDLGEGVPEDAYPIITEPWAPRPFVEGGEPPDAFGGEDGAPEFFPRDPVALARLVPQDVLEGALRDGIWDDNTPGYALISVTDEDGEQFGQFVPVEAIRDALQLQGVDTDALLRDIYADGRPGGAQDTPEVLEQVDRVRSELEAPEPDAAAIQALIDRAVEEAVIRATPMDIDPDVDIEQQVRMAIEDGRKIRFEYNGKNRVVRPTEIRPGRGDNVNVYTVDEDGNIKAYTISKMGRPLAENAQGERGPRTPVPPPPPAPPAAPEGAPRREVTLLNEDGMPTNNRVWVDENGAKWDSPEGGVRVDRGYRDIAEEADPGRMTEAEAAATEALETDRRGRIRRAIDRLLGRDRGQEAGLGPEQMQELVDNTLAGGYTVDFVTGNKPVDGYIVAAEADVPDGQGGVRKREEVVPVEDFEADPERYVEGFIERNLDKLAEDGFYLGTWVGERVDPQTGETRKYVFLDVSERIEDKEEALEAARNRGELAIWGVVEEDEFFADPQKEAEKNARREQEADQEAVPDPEQLPGPAGDGAEGPGPEGDGGDPEGPGSPEQLTDEAQRVEDRLYDLAEIVREVGLGNNNVLNFLQNRAFDRIEALVRGEPRVGRELLRRLDARRGEEFPDGLYNFFVFDMYDLGRGRGERLDAMPQVEEYLRRFMDRLDADLEDVFAEARGERREQWAGVVPGGSRVGEILPPTGEPQGPRATDRAIGDAAGPPSEPPSEPRGGRLRRGVDLLMSEGRNRFNLPTIPEGYRPQVFGRLLHGLYADANGNPIAVGDRVIHVRPGMAERYGEGVVIGKVQGRPGGLQRRGVVYRDYIKVRYPDGSVRKYVARFQRHVDEDVARERFEAEPRINWMDDEQRRVALAERVRRGDGPEPVSLAIEDLMEEVFGRLDEADAEEWRLRGDDFVAERADVIENALVEDIKEGDFIRRPDGTIVRVVQLEDINVRAAEGRRRITVVNQDGRERSFDEYRTKDRVIGELLRIRGERGEPAERGGTTPPPPPEGDQPAPPATERGEQRTPDSGDLERRAAEAEPEPPSVPDEEAEPSDFVPNPVEEADLFVRELEGLYLWFEANFRPGRIKVPGELQPGDFVVVVDNEGRGGNRTPKMFVGMGDPEEYGGYEVVLLMDMGGRTEPHWVEEGVNFQTYRQVDRSFLEAVDIDPETTKFKDLAEGDLLRVDLGLVDGNANLRVVDTFDMKGGKRVVVMRRETTGRIYTFMEDGDKGVFTDNHRPLDYDEFVGIESGQRIPAGNPGDHFRLWERGLEEPVPRDPDQWAAAIANGGYGDDVRSVNAEGLKRGEFVVDPTTGDPAVFIRVVPNFNYEGDVQDIRVVVELEDATGARKLVAVDRAVPGRVMGQAGNILVYNRPDSGGDDEDATEVPEPPVGQGLPPAFPEAAAPVPPAAEGIDTPAVPPAPEVRKGLPVAEIKQRMRDMAARLRALQPFENYADQVRVEEALELLDVPNDRRRMPGIERDMGIVYRNLRKSALLGELREVLALQKGDDDLPLRDIREIDPGMADNLDELQANHGRLIAYLKQMRDAGVSLQKLKPLADAADALADMVVYADPYNPRFRAGLGAAKRGMQNALDPDGGLRQHIDARDGLGQFLDGVAERLNEMELPPMGMRLADVVQGQERADAVAQMLAGYTMGQVRNGDHPEFGYVGQAGEGRGINKTYIIEHRETGEKFVLKYDDDYAERGGREFKGNGANAEEMVAAIYRQLGFAMPAVRRVNPDNPDPQLAGMFVMEFLDDGKFDLVDFEVAGRVLRRDMAWAGQVRLSHIAPEHRAEILDFIVANAIIGNTDRHPGNYMYGKTPDGGLRLAVIDNGLAMFNGAFGQADQHRDDFLFLRPDRVIVGRYGNANGAKSIGAEYIGSIGRDAAKSQVVEFAERMAARAELLELADPEAAAYIRTRANWIVENIDVFLDRILGNR